MDDLDRIFVHLVRTVKSRFPQYLSQPFDVSELYQNVLPYRHHRRALGVETNEDYEFALLQLLSGARDYLIVDDRMRDALLRELASANPDPAAFKQFPEASVALSPEAVQNHEAMNTRVTAVSTAPELPTEPPAPPARATSAQPVPTPKPVARPAAQSAPARPSVAKLTTAAPATAGVTTAARGVVPPEGSGCRSCGERLPAGRAISFCPHCGQSLTTVDCPACGSELEVGWRFCPACGRPAATS